LSDALLDGFLGDDVDLLDLTTHLVGISGAAGRMTFKAGTAMVVACIEDAARILSRGGADVVRHAGSGDSCAPGALLLTASGPAGALLRTWKVAQNLVEVAAGIASMTRAIVDAARAVNPAVAIACTRKYAPGTKHVSLKSILAGGAVPHRLGLSDTILLFPEHRAFLTGLSAIEIVGLLARESREKKIVVEVATVEEAIAFANAGADVIQCEKFPPADIEALSGALAGRSVKPRIAAAGGVNAGNAARYASAGADILVTSAPYWAKPADVSVRIQATGDG
jgi:molybdenum transport protein